MLWVGGWGEPMRFSKEGMQQACMSNFTKLNKLLIHSTAISLDALYAAFFTVLQKLPGYAEQLASAQASHATYANVARLYQFFLQCHSCSVYHTGSSQRVHYKLAMYTLILHGTRVCRRSQHCYHIFFTGHNYVDVYCNQMFMNYLLYTSYVFVHRE